MKVMLAPTVTVVGHSTFVEHPMYPIPNDGSDACKIGSFAAKSCYDSHGINGRANQANQEAILESKHGSVLEHATVSLYVEGVTRALTLEMNRHRLLAISQRSTRYTAEEDGAIVLEPYYADIFKRCQPECQQLPLMGGETQPDWFIPGQTKNNEEEQMLLHFLKASELAFHYYNVQVKYLMKLNPMKLTGFDLRKWARGKARNILPHCLETRVTYTANHRAWRWFVEVRSSIHAEAEIRRLAHYVLMELRKIAPEYYDDFEQTQIYDGIPEWKPQYSKV